MEEILEKNIFNDSQLLKLAPDFCPADIILRMQMRRSMVKDSHCHGLKRKQSQRNNSTKHSAADNSRINTEIVRLKDTFETENTKNEINLKNSNVILSKTKIVESKRNNFNTQASLDDIQFIERKEHDVNKEEINDLQCNGTAVDPFRCYYSNLDEVTEKLRGMKVNSDENVTNKSKYFRKSHNHDYIESNQSNNNDKFKDPMDDLQSLLIKMAIASVPTDDSVDNHNTAITKDTHECNEINSNTLEINLSSLVLESHKIKTDDNEDFLRIQSLRVNYNKRDGYLANKYFKKWRGYVARKNQQSTEQRKAVIQNFFDKLERKKNEINCPTDPANKAKLYAKDYSNYQHRYKVQKHIIALQKAKLEEQNRLIESLKYNKIIDTSRQSVEAMKEEVRRTYFEIDRHLKPKIKCMTNELKIPEIEEPALVLHCLKVPQFLQRMEKRAREREEKHALIRERRAQMEEERVRMKQQMELAKLEMDKEEKLKRMKELKEKRKREKIENIRKKQHAERMRALIVMADLHYEKNLVYRCGFQPWKKLVEMKRDNVEKARAHYKFQLRKNVFLNWMWHTEDMWYERNFKAEDFNRKKLLKRAFNGFKQHHHHYVLLRQTAEDYYELYLAQVAFRGLRRGVLEARREMQVKWERAVQYYNR
ncbi:unnamed protein product [Plutella xylostella]|uniref:(diamondback moth) hypothetical protein n=1 Tax=Plutella xylostella TaxID=51655 RepID=A0A8S4E2Y1_PLUXY|nr:unnamed protein product [Plutella xylostella]